MQEVTVNHHVPTSLITSYCRFWGVVHKQWDWDKDKWGRSETMTTFATPTQPNITTNKNVSNGTKNRSNGSSKGKAAAGAVSG